MEFLILVAKGIGWGVACYFFGRLTYTMSDVLVVWVEKKPKDKDKKKDIGYWGRRTLCSCKLTPPILEIFILKLFKSFLEGEERFIRPAFLRTAGLSVEKQH